MSVTDRYIVAIAYSHAKRKRVRFRVSEPASFGAVDAPGIFFPQPALEDNNFRFI